MIRIATFNLENLFTRPVAMNQDTDEAGRKAIEDHAIANGIVTKETYSSHDKEKLLELTEKYKWHYLNPPKNALVQLQKVRGRLFRSPKNGPIEVVADGRDDWTGWFELKREDVQWEATYNTGRVISEVRPDILITVEAENRPTLGHFNLQVLRAEFDFIYRHGMVIDGNDPRGIDLGILSQFPISEIRSHVDDVWDGGHLFSRDCPEFDIVLPSGELLIIIANHLKSKRSGNDEKSQERRQAQASRAHEIAVAALARSKLVLIGGDLNDTPDSPALASLFADGFEDVMSHPNYPRERPGTYGTGLPSQKLDYLITSTKLRTKLQDTGIERRGSYHPKIWEPFDTVKNAKQEASDHHLLWSDFDIGSQA